MLFTCIRTETIKLKRSFIWIAFFLIPIIPAFMGAGNYRQNLEILKSGWYSLWTQDTLFYSNFFYAPIIGVYCAYLWRVENFNHNRNALFTAPAPIGCVFVGKLASVCLVTCLTQLWVGILYLISGKIVGLPGLPPAVILYWLLRGVVGGMSVGALLLLLSMLIRSFAVPVAIGLAGGIAGLIVANTGYGLYFPFSLMMMGMNANRYEDVLQGQGILFFCSCAVYIVLACAVAVVLLEKRDVRA